MPPSVHLSFRRNPSYLESLRLAWRHGIFLSPESFLRTMKVPVCAFVSSSFLVLVTLFLWILSKIGIVGAGLLGYLNLDVEGRE